MKDDNNLVRMAAVISAIKLYHKSNEYFNNTDIHQLLVTQLRDQSQFVLSNVLNYLNCTLNYTELAADPDILDLHMNMLSTYDVHLQRALIKLAGNLIQYNFMKSDEQMFNLMNKLDDFLRSADIEVMLSTVDCFVIIADRVDGIREDVADRIRHTLFASLHDGYSIMSIGNEDNVNWEYNFIILKTI